MKYYSVTPLTFRQVHSVTNTICEMSLNIMSIYIEKRSAAGPYKWNVLPVRACQSPGLNFQLILPPQLEGKLFRGKGSAIQLS